MVQRTGRCNGCKMVIKQFNDQTIQRIQNPSNGKVFKLYEDGSVVEATAGIGAR